MEADPSLTQYVSEEEYRQMGLTFTALAESGKSLTRLPRRQVDRQKVLEAIHEAFVLIGGVPRFAMWAHQNPDSFYKLWAKTAPNALQVSGQLAHQFIKPSLPPSPLDQEFTDADFTEESNGDGSPVEGPAELAIRASGR